MSMQRIFNVARKLGTPVIMTDPSGREPLVVLPLDQFEAMAGVSADQVENLPVEPQVAPVIQEKSDKNTHNKAKKEPAILINKELVAAVSELEDIPLEERFYLEPLEGAESSPS
jgi:hypothetical protein